MSDIIHQHTCSSFLTKMLIWAAQWTYNVIDMHGQLRILSLPNRMGQKVWRWNSVHLYCLALASAPLSPHLEYTGFQTLLRLQSSKVLLFSFYNKIRISGFYEYVMNTFKEDHPVRSAGSTARQGVLYSSGLFPHGNTLLSHIPLFLFQRQDNRAPPSTIQFCLL